MSLPEQGLATLLAAAAAAADGLQVAEAQEEEAAADGLVLQMALALQWQLPA